MSTKELKKIVLSFKPKERFLNNKDIDEIIALGVLCPRLFVKDLALDVKFNHDLRVIPLVLLLSLLPNRPDPKDKLSIPDAIYEVINMPSELITILGMYWKHRIIPNSRPFLKGLAQSFCRFTEEEFLNYGDTKVVKLRDVMFLCHPKPMTDQQVILFRKIANNQLRRK